MPLFNSCAGRKQMERLARGNMHFDEFCAAAISPYQMEALENWEEIASTAFDHFEREGNRVISFEQLSQVCMTPCISISIVVCIFLSIPGFLLIDMLRVLFDAGAEYW